MFLDLVAQAISSEEGKEFSIQYNTENVITLSENIWSWEI
jgi:hypothetical protein